MAEEKQKQDPQKGPMVDIKINEETYSIHRGNNTVAQIKAVAGVPVADDLVQLIDGKLNPLADDGSFTIKGGEIFVSHPKDGKSA